MSEHRDLTAAQARDVAYLRQQGACASCGTQLPLDAFHAHHRTRRRELGWCPCNIVALHSDCHVIAPQAVHQRVTWARERGLIVPTWDDPRRVPLLTEVPWRAWSLLSCDGLLTQAPEGTRTPDGGLVP